MSDEYPDWAIPGLRMTSGERQMYLQDIQRVRRETVLTCLEWVKANYRDDGTAQRVEKDIRREFKLDAVNETMCAQP